MSKFMDKYGVSDNLLCQMCKGNTIVCQDHISFHLQRAFLAKE